jgi:hypothetical protein
MPEDVHNLKKHISLIVMGKEWHLLKLILLNIGEWNMIHWKRKVNAKQSRYTPWKCLGGEEV